MLNSWKKFRAGLHRFTIISLFFLVPAIAQTNQLVGEPIQTSSGFTGSYFFFFLQTIFILGVFAGIGWFVVKITKNKGLSQSGAAGGNAVFDLVSELPMGMGKKLSVVRVVNDFYLIGVGQDGMTMMKQIEDKEALDLFRLELAKPKPAGTFFAQVLERYLTSRSEGAADAGRTQGVQREGPLSVTRRLRDRVKKIF